MLTTGNALSLRRNKFLLSIGASHGFHFKKYLKKSKKIVVHQQEYGPSLRFYFPQISEIFSISRKKLGITKYYFQ